MKIKTKFRQAPARKRPNITLEMMWIRSRIVLIWAGRATARNEC